MAVFYAYFLIFGFNQASEGKIELTSQSESIQIHLNQLVDADNSESINFYASFDSVLASDEPEQARVRQKWKYFIQNPGKIISQSSGSLFNRPPPQLI